MTKKYWKDWQNRLGETKNIYKFWFHLDGWKRKSCRGELNNLAGDKLAKATFNHATDTVELVIERWHQTFTKSIHIQNEYITLHREDIASIEFKKEQDTEGNARNNHLEK